MKRGALLAALVLTGCGSTSTGTAPRTIRLDWREPACAGVRVEVARLIVGPSRWRIEATVLNEDAPLRIDRPDSAGEAYFGVVRGDRRTADALHGSLLADRFVPAFPRLLRHGARWHGAYSGPGRLPRGKPLRLVFGRFSHLGSSPRGFLCVSKHHVTL